MKNTRTLLALALAVCLYPKDMKIMGSEFSTGTSDSPAYMVEISGMLNGKYTTLTSYNMTLGKLLGMGRFTAPDRIDFEPSDTDKLECRF